MKARFRMKVAAFFCAAVALALVGFAAWKIVPQLMLIARTKDLRATVVKNGQARDITLIREHDDRGYVIYGLRILFTYEVQGRNLIQAAETPFRTRNVAEILKLRDAYSNDEPHEIRYDPAKPETIYFEAGLPARLWEPALYALLGAAGFLLVAFLLFGMARPPKLCASCQAELESYYKFCPGCSATVSKS